MRASFLKALGLFIVLLCTLGTPGCSFQNLSQALKERANAVQLQTLTPSQEGVSVSEGAGDFAAGAAASSPAATISVSLFFSNPEGRLLVAQPRTIPKVEGIARATIKELIAGPRADSGLLPTIPAGTVLRDINVREDGVAVVDFSRELIAGHPGGSLGESLTVYSIVNTLTQFPRVQCVQFLVEGQYVDTLAGHLLLAEPVSRNADLIKP